MVLKTARALTFAVSTVAFLSATTPSAFNVSEPVSIAGVPPVTLGPGIVRLMTHHGIDDDSLARAVAAIEAAP